MDHHHHHWRPTPAQTNECPVCSVSHFPFCSRHPPYNQQNPDFSTQQHYPRYGFDPHPGPIVPTHLQLPYMGNPTDGGFWDPRPWQRDPSHPSVYDYYGGGNDYIGEVGRTYKRPRVDEIVSSESYQNPLMMSSDDERRLKLIRDHGAAGTVGPMPPRKEEMYNFEDPAIVGSFDRKRPFLEQGQQYVQNDYRNGFHYNATNSSVDQQGNLSQPLLHPTNDSYYAQNSHQINPRDSIAGNNWQAPYNGLRSSSVASANGNFRSSKPYGMQNSNHMPPIKGALSGAAQYGAANMNERGGYLGEPNGQPPLPASPPPPLPVDPPVRPPSNLTAQSPSKSSFTLFPIPVSSSDMGHLSHPAMPEAHTSSQPYYHKKPIPQTSIGFNTETSSTQYGIGSQSYLVKQLSLDKAKVIDAANLFKPPLRATRPDHFVIILRGLPGSGKSYLAKMLRDIEVENGGDAPRIHSMDDYFMTEVEKVEENDGSKSSCSVRSKKPAVKTVIEYCYEPEMEEAYRSSMLKAFKRTLEEGTFTFIIVDDRNLRVADFAQFWATAKRSGYEVYILEAMYKDPAGCAARNVHGFTLDEIQKMAGQWEEAPSIYMQLDIKSLFHGDDLKESGIREVDMDMEDDYELQECKPEKSVGTAGGDNASEDASKDEKRWDAEGDHPTGEVKELSRSKWSNDLEEDDSEKSEGLRSNSSSLSGLIQVYGKKGKSVRWGDQGGNTGFLIGAAKKANLQSLVIGPGTGYNLKSNPLPEEERLRPANSIGKSKKQSIFQEQLRAERESFRAVFDRRRQRIGGLDVEEE